MANNRPTLYTGVTNNLVKRCYEHKHNLVPGFTAKYMLHKLVYYEEFNTIEEAIIRENQVKDMNRVDKLEMIKGYNPTLSDLYDQIIG